MAPVCVEKESPDGRVGEIDQDTTETTAGCGVTVDIETPLAKVRELGV